MRLLQAWNLVLLPAGLAAEILKTQGFSSCMDNAQIKVNKMDIEYDKGTNLVTFDVSGTSEKEQEVIAKLIVTAYGKDVYSKEFDPCDEASKVDQLCPGKMPSEDLMLMAADSLCLSSRWLILSQRLTIYTDHIHRQDSLDCILRSGSGRGRKVGA
jgi:ML-like domain